MQHHSEGEIKAGRWRAALLTDVSLDKKAHLVAEALRTRGLERKVPVGRDEAQVRAAVGAIPACFEGKKKRADFLLPECLVVFPVFVFSLLSSYFSFLRLHFSIYYFNT